MILFEDALTTVLSQAGGIKNFVSRDGGERVALSDSIGRILAEDIFSDMDMPPFDKSAVDGYACRMPVVGVVGIVRAQNFVPLPVIKVVETIPAGKTPKKTIGPNECSKIMTGAMVPKGADCIVMVEDTEVAGDNVIRITRDQKAKNICYRAEDIRSGDLVLEIGRAHV